MAKVKQRFCDRCDVSLDLHYSTDPDEPDCEQAELRAGLIERCPIP